MGVWENKKVYTVWVNKLIKPLYEKSLLQNDLYILKKKNLWINCFMFGYAIIEVFILICSICSYKVVGDSFKKLNISIFLKVLKINFQKVISYLTFL